MTPWRRKHQDRTAYIFGFAGCLWLSLLSASYASDALQGSGDLSVGYMEFTKEPFIHDFLVRFFRGMDAASEG